MHINKDLIVNLSLNCDVKLQSKSIEILSNLSLLDIRYLVLPNGKECWDNAAEVIYNIMYHNITEGKKLTKEEEESLFSIMEWTKDLNWPGTLTIINAIKLLDTSLIAQFIENSLIQAINDKDENWIDSLKILFNMIGNVEEVYFNNCRYYQILLGDI